MECHRTGTKAGRGARWKGCAFTRPLWNWAGTVLLKRWTAMLLLSALSAKDFAEAIVLCLCGLLGEGGQLVVILRLRATRCLRMPTFVIEHQARHATLVIARFQLDAFILVAMILICREQQ